MNRNGLFHLFNDSLEGLGVVQGEVGKDLAVDLDTSLVQLVHEHAVRHVVIAHGSVDTDDPEGSEFAFLVSSVAVSVGLSLFVRVLRHSPDILSGSELTFGLFEDFLAPGSRGHGID